MNFVAISTSDGICHFVVVYCIANQHKYLYRYNNIVAVDHFGMQNKLL